MPPAGDGSWFGVPQLPANAVVQAGVGTWSGQSRDERYTQNRNAQDGAAAMVPVIAVQNTMRRGRADEENGSMRGERRLGNSIIEFDAARNERMPACEAAR